MFGKLRENEILFMTLYHAIHRLVHRLVYRIVHCLLENLFPVGLITDGAPNYNLFLRLRSQRGAVGVLLKIRGGRIGNEWSSIRKW